MRRTPAHGHRRLHLQGSGRASSRSRGRRGVTAARGTPQGKTSRLSACPCWLGKSGESIDASSFRFLSAAARLDQSQAEDSAAE